MAGGPLLRSAHEFRNRERVALKRGDLTRTIGVVSDSSVVSGASALEQVLGARLPALCSDVHVRVLCYSGACRRGGGRAHTLTNVRSKCLKRARTTALLRRGALIAAGAQARSISVRRPCAACVVHSPARSRPSKVAARAFASDARRR